MILSHTYRFIFIKTRKTAGTSIEIALSRFCGDRDVITPITKEDEVIRTQLGYRGPQNYRFPPCEMEKDEHAGGRWKFYNHMPAALIRERIGEEIWRSYFKFCFVRNPWDTVVSHYYWKYRTEPRPPLSDVVMSGDPILRSDLELYTIQDHLAVDYVGRYERLEADLDAVARRLQLPGRLVPLPCAKTRFRTDRRHYRDVVRTPERERIGEVFAREIALFSYEW